MASENYHNSFRKLLNVEGGFSDHPDDNGGPTNFGVTQRTYNYWRRLENLPQQSVKKITVLEASRLYKKLFWNAVKGDLLPLGLDHIIFDYAVNSGPKRAIKALQKELGTSADGIIGPETRGLIKEIYHKDNKVEKIILAIMKKRLSWLHRLSDWKVFGRGWTNRINIVRKEALEMLDNGEQLALKLEGGK